MSTVPGFPDATSPTPATGLLWLTEGSGGTRDKKVTAGGLVTDLLGVAINDQAAAGSPIVPATDLLPVARGDVGGKASVDAVVTAGLPQAVEALAVVSTVLDGTESVVVRTAASTAKRVPLSGLQRHIVVPNDTITLSGFNNGADSLLSVDGSANDSMQIMMDLSARGTHIHIDLDLAGKSASATNAAVVALTVDLEDLLSATEFASLGLGGFAHVRIGTLPYSRLFAVSVGKTIDAPPALSYFLKLADVATGADVPWSTIVPINNTGVVIGIDIFGTAIPTP